MGIKSQRLHKLLLIISIMLLASFEMSGCSTRAFLPSEESGESVPAGNPEEENAPAQGREDGTKQDSIMIASDIHYLAEGLRDDGQAFQDMVNYGDGKVVTYISQITDALIETAVGRRPRALILSGDLTLEGEYASHEELAKKLQAVEKAGIPVLVIPGNHDINNRRASGYSGDGQYPVSPASKEDFRKLYRDYGYEEALYEDPASLSYIYPLDEKTWVMMLDSCQYTPRAQVGGMISSDTYDWIEERLEEAWHKGIRVLPVSHHNLLDQSEIYVEDCTIEHSENLIDLMEGWRVPLYLSGHLHVQHYKYSSSEGNNGLYEIVTSSLATPFCRYGVLEMGDGEGMSYGFSYRTEMLDMEQWARDSRSTIPDLVEFSEFGEPFLKRVFYNQAKRNLMRMELPEARAEAMAEYYARLNFYYYQGKGVEIAAQAREEAPYAMWQGDAYGSVLADYVEYIVRDSVKDYNTLKIEGDSFLEAQPIY